jgi:hypothetical protein
MKQEFRGQIRRNGGVPVSGAGASGSQEKRQEIAAGGRIRRNRYDKAWNVMVFCPAARVIFLTVSRELYRSEGL